MPLSKWTIKLNKCQVINELVKIENSTTSIENDSEDDFKAQNSRTQDVKLKNSNLINRILI